MACNQAENNETFSSLCTQPGVSKTQRPALPLFFQPLRVKCPGCTPLHLCLPMAPSPWLHPGLGTARGHEARTLL